MQKRKFGSALSEFVICCIEADVIGSDRDSWMVLLHRVDKRLVQITFPEEHLGAAHAHHDFEVVLSREGEGEGGREVERSRECVYYESE